MLRVLIFGAALCCSNLPVFAQDIGFGDSNPFTIDTTATGTGGDTGFGDSNPFAIDTTATGTGGDTGFGDSNPFAIDTTATGTGGYTGFGDSNPFAIDTTATGTGGDTGFGDSNPFAIDTTATGTGGDTGFGDSNTFAIDTTATGTGGDTGFGDSNPFAIDTTATGTGGDTGFGDSNPFAIDTTATGTGGDTGFGDSNPFAIDTTATGTGGDTGFGDSNPFAIDTTATGTGGDTGFGDSNPFAIDTTATGTGGDTGFGDSNPFAIDTTATGTGGDTGFGDSNTFAIDTTDGNTTEGYLENVQVSGGDFASPFYEFNDSHGSPLALDTKVFFRGSTYVFQDAGVSASHPFMIGQSWGDTNSSLVTGGPLNGSGGQVSLNIPMDFNGSLYYFCTNHTSMIAPLIIGDEGHPVFDLNASALLALTGQNLAFGNYAVVEQNESKVDLEPVVQDANGTWFPTQASDYLNLVPNRFALFDDLKQWFDDRNLQPIGFLDAVDHNASGIDSNETQPNTAPQFQSDGNLSVTENQTFVYEFNASDPDANTTLSYSILSGEDAGKFTLNTTTGGLSFTTAPDFESPEDSNADNIYQLSIQVSDGEANATLNVSVSVQDKYEPSKENHTVDLNASVGLEMIWVEPGTFMMGSPESEAGHDENETQHLVTLTKGFYLGKYEVTQAQYKALMTSYNAGNSNFAAKGISWNATQIFIDLLNEREKDAGRLPDRWAYVLPTEAQWEYACRAGTTTAFSWGDIVSHENANYQGSGYGGPRDVGQYAANPWGFFDMHGNIEEWVADWFDNYSNEMQIDPSGPETGTLRVRRGGSWGMSGERVRSAFRRGVTPSASSNDHFGFRLAFREIPNSAPTELNATSSLAFNENLPVGSVIAEFNATDPDGDSLAYSLVDGNGSTHNHLFTLESNGTLKTATSFDYETNASSYSIRVQAKDEHNASIEKEFTLTLLDVHENTAPHFQSDGNLSVTENQTFVYEFNASDPDANTTLSYSILSGDDAGKFTLNSTTGGLSFTTAPDFESPEDSNADNIYQLSIQVSDGEKNATLNVSVTVEDLSYEPSKPNVVVQSAAELEMIWVEPGTFTMGSPTTESGRGTDETQHEVTLTRGFYLSKFEVTQAQYQAVMEGNPDGLSATPSQIAGANRPVESVSWSDLQIFIQRLNASEQAAGRLAEGESFGLPTEAEWEYACRAGSTTTYSWGDSFTTSNANYTGANINSTSNVGSFQANAWGFFDMHGNVWEYCADWYGNYTNGSVEDPTGPTTGTNRVKRGGSYVKNASFMRSAHRNSEGVNKRTAGIGFRLAFYPAYPQAPDNTPPVVTLLGDSNITHEAGPEYVDAGAKWNDAVDGNGTADSNGTVNSQVPGIYLITYTYTDSSGNPAVPVTRTIQVEDTTPPVITLIGDENVTHLASTPYIDEGAKWNDIVDGNGSADANGTVDSDTPGIYQITYSATDAAGNEAEPVVRTINVVDNDVPTITLLGDANITHEAGPEYVDAGARWNDSVDGNGSADANGTVNSQVPGIYLITYTYTDSSGNPAVPVTRTIQVEDTTPPVITLIGDENVTHLASTTYIDQGAKWNDIVDGNGSADANGTVDSDTPGIYQITYDYTDHAGNEAEPVVRTINVVDSQAPVITLLGDSNITHEAGPEYVDTGARWNDAVDGNGTSDANGTVNSQVPGIYLITYTYTDSSGNPAVPVTRTIEVVDTTPPVISLIGDQNVTHLASTTYIDQGAKWNDIVDGNGSADANGSVDHNTPGIYQITYSATDAAGNEAEPVVRTINVVDSQAPVITLIGDSNITHEAGPEYVDAGARWNDSVDGNGTSDANGTVNSQVPGIYLITYTYTDSSGNPAVPVTRTIEVVDTTPPVITLIGDENVTHLASTPYIDEGAKWNDIVDGNGSADANGTVDSDTPGIYQITYDYTDHAGNEAEPVVRTINVVDSQAPVITLIGDSNFTHEAGPEYVDAGANWNDSVDGNGTADANGTVNSQVPGIYLITYTYTDSSGNPAVPVTRTIEVVDTTPPVISLIGDQNVTHLASTTYIDQGAKWNDIVDGNGSADANGTVDSDTPGIYQITYDFTDHAGNPAPTVYRSVQVVDNQDNNGNGYGYGDSNGFPLDTTDSGTGGDTGVGDSNGFTLDTTESGTGGDTGHGDSNGFTLDTTDSGTAGDTGHGDSNGFALDTTDSGTGGDTGHGDSNGFTLDTTESGTGGDTGVGDSNGFTLDTTDSGTGGDTGHGDSNEFTLDTTDSGTGGDTGFGDSNPFAIDTTSRGTGGDTGFGDSNSFKLDTTEPVVIAQKPLVNTSNTMLEDDGSIQLSGDVYFDGGGLVEDFGFVLSSTISLDKSKSKVIWVRAVGKPEEFTLKVTQSPFPNVMYYRAWARNSAGYGIGQVKKVRIPEAPKPWWGNAVKETGGWKTSDWFGTFIYYEKGWLYHAQLGWLYSSDTNTEGVWLWKEKLGWLWTKEGIWPYLYKNDSSSWIYYTTNRNSKPLFYDYLTEQYLFFEDSSVDQSE